MGRSGRLEIEFIMAALGYRMNDANDQTNQKIFTTSRRDIAGISKNRSAYYGRKAYSRNRL